MNARGIGVVLSVLTLLAAGTAPAAAQIDEDTMMETTEVRLRWALKGEHELVSPEEREALGLDDISWTRRHGKVHPDVYKALEKAERIGERAKKAREAYLDPAGYAGMVYVQVRLKHEQKGRADSAENKAAIKQLQDKVLSQLTAAEFFVRYLLARLNERIAILNEQGAAAAYEARREGGTVATLIGEQGLLGDEDGFEIGLGF